MIYTLKSTFGFICMLLLCISLISVQAAIEDDPSIKSIQQGTENLQDIASSPDPTEYLKQEWAKVFENKLQQSLAGRALLKINASLKLLNPLFKNIIGIEYSFSLAFIIGLTIWITIALFLSNPLETILNNKFFAIISSFAISSLIGLSGIIRKAVDLLSMTINNVWIAWLVFIITLIIAIVIVKLGKNLENQIKKTKERQEKEKTNQDRTILHIGAESVKEELKGYNNKDIK